jgi:hypothetical protein
MAAHTPLTLGAPRVSRGAPRYRARARPPIWPATASYARGAPASAGADASMASISPRYSLRSQSAGSWPRRSFAPDGRFVPGEAKRPRGLQIPEVVAPEGFDRGVVEAHAAARPARTRAWPSVSSMCTQPGLGDPANDVVEESGAVL